MATLSSTNIEVFPTSARGYDYNNNKFLSEYSITNIVNKFIDTDGFVITRDFMTGEVYNQLDLNIHGYYFTVKQETGATGVTELLDSFSTEKNIFAYIKVSKSGFHDLVGKDESSKYSGITFVSKASDIPSSEEANYIYTIRDSAGQALPILARESTSATWTIPENVKNKFDLASFGIPIDGGVIS